VTVCTKKLSKIAAYRKQQKQYLSDLPRLFMGFFMVFPAEPAHCQRAIIILMMSIDLPLPADLTGPGPD